MAVDIAIPDIPRAIADFKQQLVDFGRDRQAVEITLVVMAPVTADLLKSYRDIGIDRCNIGVGVENWGNPEMILPMIERFATLTAEL